MFRGGYLFKISFVLLTLALLGCGGANVTPSNKASTYSFDGEEETDDKPESDVFLDEKGLPSLKDLMKAGPLGEKFLGDKKAPVTVIKYASLTCPFCRVFQIKTFRKFKAKYIDTGKVKFILREFPIGHTSGHATVAMRCIGQKNTAKFFDLYNRYITQQRKWVSQEVRFTSIYKIAAQVGITRNKFDSCIKNQKIIDGLKWVKQRGRNLGVSGTPTFFINGKKYRKPLTFEEMQRLVEPHLG